MPGVLPRHPYQRVVLSILRLGVFFVFVFGLNVRAAKKECQTEYSALVDGTNELELEVHGLWRSGHHAIINWIRDHFEDQPIYYNDRSVVVDFCKDHCFVHRDHSVIKDPNGEKIRIFTSTDVEIDIPGYHTVEGRILNPKIVLEAADDVSVLRDAEADEFEFARDQGVPETRALYIRNFQNMDPAFTKIVPESNRGHSKKKIRVVVLRDPYNWGASLQRMYNVTGGGTLNWAILTWKAMAEEMIEKGRGYAKDMPTVFISYNRWFTDEGYRRELSEKLGLGPYVEPGEEVSSYGGGSSFDGFKYDFKSQQMKTLTRWKIMKNTKRYEAIWKDPEIRVYSETLFGFAPEGSGEGF